MAFVGPPVRLRPLVSTLFAVGALTACGAGEEEGGGGGGGGGAHSDGSRRCDDPLCPRLESGELFYTWSCTHPDLGTQTDERILEQRAACSFAADETGWLAGADFQEGNGPTAIVSFGIETPPGSSTAPLGVLPRSVADCSKSEDREDDAGLVSVDVDLGPHGTSNTTCGADPSSPDFTESPTDGCITLCTECHFIDAETDPGNPFPAIAFGGQFSFDSFAEAPDGEGEWRCFVRGTFTVSGCSPGLCTPL